jgi:hypothetical protein
LLNNGVFIFFNSMLQSTDKLYTLVPRAITTFSTTTTIVNNDGSITELQRFKLFCNMILIFMSNIISWKLVRLLVGLSCLMYMLSTLAAMCVGDLELIVDGADSDDGSHAAAPRTAPRTRACQRRARAELTLPYLNFAALAIPPWACALDRAARRATRCALSSRASLLLQFVLCDVRGVR